MDIIWRKNNNNNKTHTHKLENLLICTTIKRKNPINVIYLFILCPERRMKIAHIIDLNVVVCTTKKNQKIFFR